MLFPVDASPGVTNVPSGREIGPEEEDVEVCESYYRVTFHGSMILLLIQ